jgi:molecular chaperone DnaK (HSP70)
LYFDKNGHDVKWGYGIPLDKEPLKWFKLLLLDATDLPAEIVNSIQLQEARRLTNETGKEPIAIIASFLRKLWDHSVESIRRAIGAESFEQSKFHVVITLPAIWPPYAQNQMKQAAQQSGILDVRPAGTTTLQFISEPEAAALATIKDMGKRSTIKVSIQNIISDLVSVYG